MKKLFWKFHFMNLRSGPCYPRETYHYHGKGSLEGWVSSVQYKKLWWRFYMVESTAMENIP